MNGELAQTPRWFIGEKQVTQEKYRCNIIQILSGSERFKEMIKNMPFQPNPQVEKKKGQAYESNYTNHL